jgi:hypothetical protein
MLDHICLNSVCELLKVWQIPSCEAGSPLVAGVFMSSVQEPNVADYGVAGASWHRHLIIVFPVCDARERCAADVLPMGFREH